MTKKVLLCTGKSCRKRKAALRRVTAAIPKGVNLKEVKCQSICAGPVVALKVDGQWEWYKKLRKRRHFDALRQSLVDGEVDEGLAARWVKKRSGKRR
jgi:hypothetical protein